MRHIKNPECSFCKAEIKDATFAEQYEFRAIYNKAPILPGHSLIIPQWHIISLVGLSDEEVARMVVFSRAVIRNLVRIFKADGFNWTIQEGAAAGQTIPHVHLHLIPRREGDLPSPGDWYPRLIESECEQIDNDERTQLSSQQMRVIVDHIRSAWQAE